MNTTFLKDAFGWGFALWFIGYVLGIVFFFFVPPAFVGWVVMPFGIIITVYVLFKKIQGGSRSYYAGIGFVWMLIAIVLDYLLLVQVFHPADGYYKFDVYLYYALTLLLPLFVGYLKGGSTKES